MSGDIPRMRAENTDELLLTRYLLGDLAEDEQVRVEDRAFMDPEYLAALEAVETDLIDAYVQGELATADRNAFERKFLVSSGAGAKWSLRWHSPEWLRRRLPRRQELRSGDRRGSPG